MKKIILLVLSIVLFSSPVLAMEKLAEFTITWDKGASAEWTNGKLNIEIVEWSKDPARRECKITIYDDGGKLKAFLKGNNSSTPIEVGIIMQNSGLTLMEPTPSGWSIVHIYKGEKYAVMSRHLFLLGSPLPQQYYGTIHP